MTHKSDVVTYVHLVTRETACIALTMAALHDPDVKEA